MPFKIPKTSHRVLSFEDRWKLGYLIGCVARSGEHLVAIESGVHEVSTVKRRTPDQRRSADLIMGMAGTPEELILGSGERRI